MKIETPTFVYCADGRYYENLIYQDFPTRRAWFVCFSATEPAEIVVRESAYRDMPPEAILRRRGFGECLARLINARRKGARFFGWEEDPLTKERKPGYGADGISWYLVLRKGVPLPAPNQYDECAASWPIFPAKKGVFFGEVRAK